MLSLLILVSPQSAKATSASFLNISIKSHVERKRYEATYISTIKQIKEEHLELIKKNTSEHQQLLESATAAAVDRANESEREVQVQIAALKVLSLSKDEEIAKIKENYEGKLRKIKGDVLSLDNIVEANNKTIAERNDKIKKLKESYEEKIQQYESKYNKKADELATIGVLEGNKVDSQYPVRRRPGISDFVLMEDVETE